MSDLGDDRPELSVKEKIRAHREAQESGFKGSEKIPDWKALTARYSTQRPGARAALRRELFRHPDRDGIGKLAGAVGRELLRAAMAGDVKRVSALTALIDQAEGKPKESIEHSGSVAAVRLVGFASPVEEDAAPHGFAREALNVARVEELGASVENTPHTDIGVNLHTKDVGVNLNGSSASGPSRNGSSEILP